MPRRNKRARIAQDKYSAILKKFHKLSEIDYVEINGEEDGEDGSTQDSFTEEGNEDGIYNESIDLRNFIDNTILSEAQLFNL